jgi:hypothetical protein
MNNKQSQNDVSLHCIILIIKISKIIVGVVVMD